MSQTPAIVADGLVAGYGASEVLHGVSLAVAPGERVALLGPNGSGKSTLLAVLSTLRAPRRGTARVAGRDVVREAAAVRRAVGIVFQGPSHDPHLTVEENLDLFARLHRVPARDRQQRLEQALAGSGLAGRTRERMGRLSGGEARRVEIARCLLTRPSVLLLDEPGAGLDPRARLEIAGQLDALAGGGTAILFATHLGEEAEHADRVVVLDRGQVAAEETPALLKSRVGGGVVLLRGATDAATAAEIRAAFGVEAALADGALRIETERAHEFVPRVVERFPGRFRSVTLREPTLEDAFVHLTGREFDAREGA
jgi:ABC-2 type transport system ATP-binding protein